MRKVDTVLGDFDPSRIRSTSVLFDAHPGDFVHTEIGWVVSHTLGMGDLEAGPGFVKRLTDA